MIGRGHYVQPVPGAGSVVNRSLAEQHDGLLPTLDGEGPQPLPVRLGMDADFDPAFYDKCVAAMFDHNNDTSLFENLRACIEATPISWTSCKQTLARIAREVQHGDGEALGMTDDEFRQVLCQLQDHHTWDFLQDSTDTPLNVATWDLRSLETWFTHLHEHADTPWTRHEHVPRDFANVRIVLHVYAGRRRPGDFQWFLDEMTSKFSFPTWVVSLDIIISREHGDVSNAETRSFWRDAIRRRWVCAFLCGPHVKRGPLHVNKTLTLLRLIMTKDTKDHDQFEAQIAHGGSHLYA